MAPAWTASLGDADAGVLNVRETSLRRNFLWIFIGNSLYRGCQWGMLIALAKLSSVEMTGRFALAFAVTAPVFMLANLQSRAIIVTDATGEFRFRDYVVLRIATTLLAAAGIVALVLYAGYGRQTAPIIYAITLAKAFESLSDIYHGALQQQDRMDRVAVSLTAKGGLSLITLIVALYLTGSVLLGALGLACSWALVFALYDVPAVRRLGPAHASGPGIRLARLWRLACLGLPLGVVTMLMSLKVNVSRLFVAQYLGERELGIFAAMAYATMAGDMVMNSLGQGAAPRLARHYVSGDYAAFRHVLSRLIAVGAAVGVIGVSIAGLAGRELLVIVYRPEYAHHLNVFLILVAASGVGYVGSMLGYTLTASRFLKAQMPIAAAIVGTAALGCLFLVPRHGLGGAATAELLAAVTQSAGLLWVVRRALKDLKVAARA